MMTTHDAMEGPRPEIGEDVLISVVQSQTRTTYFPDMAVVLGRSPTVLEIVLLRQEVALRSQQGTVKGEDGNALTLEFRPGEVRAEMFDIAHLRMELGPAVDFAFGVLSLAMNNGGVELETLVNRLHSAHVPST